MIDLETLSTKPTAAIIAIGAVMFTGNGVYAGFESYIKPELAIGSIDDPTLEWWRQQDKDVFLSVFGGQAEPFQALSNLSEWIKLYKPEEVWANSPTFDCSILRNSYQRLELECPWHFTSERDFRTMTSLAKESKIDYSAGYKGIVKHNPLSDARHQAFALNIILNRLTWKE